jgi:hypothetical protein
MSVCVRLIFRSNKGINNQIAKKTSITTAKNFRKKKQANE